MFPLYAYVTRLTHPQGEVFQSGCELNSLLGNYMEGRHPDTGDNPEHDLEALRTGPRRSARLAAAACLAAAKLNPPAEPAHSTPLATPEPSAPRPPRKNTTRTSNSQPKKKKKTGQKKPLPVPAYQWFDANGDLKVPRVSWEYV
jgi:hypothetical protein